MNMYYIFYVFNAPRRKTCGPFFHWNFILALRIHHSRIANKELSTIEMKSRSLIFKALQSLGVLAMIRDIHAVIHI